MTNKIKLEVGQWVELNNGEKLKVREKSYGDYFIGEYAYDQSGKFIFGARDYPLSVSRILPHIKLPNGDVLFEGDYAKRRDGRVVGPLEHDGGTEENGPWCVDGFWYHSDGKTNTNNSHYSLFAKADPPKVEKAPSLFADAHTPKLEADKPTLWRDMTDAEKGALLLAHHEGEVIEATRVDIPDDWMAITCMGIETMAYRIKPAEPKRTTVSLWVYAKPKDYALTKIGTIDLIDGKPDPASIKMEELE